MHDQAGAFTRVYLLAAADAHGLDVRVLSGFADETVARLVGIDGMDEVPLAVVTLGNESADVEVGPISNRDPAPLLLDVAPVAPRPIRLPLLVDAQAESTLTADQVTGWRQGANAVSSVILLTSSRRPQLPKSPSKPSSCVGDPPGSCATIRSPTMRSPGRWPRPPERFLSTRLREAPCSSTI